MNVRYRVELSQAERDELTAMLAAASTPPASSSGRRFCWRPMGAAAMRRLPGRWGWAVSTVYRTKRRFVEGNLERALSEEPRPGAERKLTGKEEALLVATACAKPPAGRARWTLKLLADAMVKLTDHESLSGETVRRRLAENGLKPWRKDMWCIPQVDGEYVARMEDVLDLYAEAPDPERPVVCFDESPVQLIGEVRQPIPAQPGQLERYDYEYRRNGTVNLFVCFDAHRPWRKVKVTERRAAVDYAHCMRELVDVHYPDAACIRVVQDNLSTHRPAPSMRHSRPPRPGEFCGASSSTTPPSTPAGSTWSRSRSACSAASVWTAASTTPNGSSAKSQHGNDNETPPAPASNGCSQPTRPAPKWAAPIPSRPKSHNHCAEVLALLWQIYSRRCFPPICLLQYGHR